jgi:GrpB-like predicted nucleotidyltransferase (UPF0157 family)
MEIVPYDPAWPAGYAREAVRIGGALGPLAVRIDHNGSTAVPGLAAKPVIDIQVSVLSLHPIDSYAEPLAAIGYSHLPHADDAFCPFFYKPARWPHTHHVHVVRHGGDEERRTLAFRDYLRSHDDAAREYERLKLALAVRYAAESAAERESYAQAKSEFVERILAIALRGYQLPSAV